MLRRNQSIQVQDIENRDPIRSNIEMAMLTKQAHDASSLNSATRFRYGAPQRSENHGFFASPTESEFSEHYESKPFARQWDEERVAEWLRSINCAQYVELFLVNNINGACLVELDRDHLRDMGIKKIGDQIRIASQIKRFRNVEMSRFSKRQTNRESLIALDNVSFTSLSSNGTSSSPKPRSKTSLQDKRNSRLIELPGDSLMGYGQRTGSRPSSPYIDDHRNRSQKYIGMSPPQRGETHPASASSTNGKPPLSAASIRGGYAYSARSATTPAETPQTARFNLQSHVRASPSFDQSASQAAILPPDKPFIRVIYDTGRASVVNIDGWKSIEDVMIKALRKGALNEAHGKNYCFHVLDGTEANSALCRKINDDEVRRICSDLSRAERSRLILRKIHMGEPDEEQLRTAVSIALQQQSQQTHNVVIPTNVGQRKKLEQLTGEPLPPISYPLSPASAKQRQQEYAREQRVMQLAEPRILATRQRKMKELFGGRPPSELIASDLATYFPDHDKGEIDRTVRQSIRRSRRISRAASRLSTVSNFSIASSLRDAPPLPAISDAWLNGANQSKVLRPLSVLRLGGPGYRDSITSSVLEPLDEESPLESDRKSFASAYSPGASEVAVTDPEGVTTLKSYYNDDGGSSIANSSMSGDTEGEDSLNKRLSRMVHEDSEESDEELSEYLETSSWDNIRYMKGSLIGKGSFGSVYLALHAVTGELMAVKQVEIPADETDQHSERKKNMLTALKHEISLLRELKHPNIVQYLGSNSDDTHLNIFLEYVPGGSVATMLVNYGPLGESLISNFVRQILTGLEYLHDRDIIHRDIKGANILVDNKGSVKISDFGISKRVDVSQLSAPEPGPATKATKALNRVSLQGSVFWMAPEVVRQTSYTLKADIWSLGCLIIEMFTGVHPHPNMSQLQAIFKIGSSRGGDAAPEIPEGVSTDLDEFLRRTFEMEWEKRPGAKELRQTRWVLGAAAV